MRVECLVMRDGPTQIPIGGMTYLFMPYRPRGEKGPVTSMCEISSEDHLAHIKRFPYTFREFVDGQPLPESHRQIVVDLSGFSIEKSGDGYICMNKITKEAAGKDETWKENRETAAKSPFDTEFAAYQWLKEEVAMMASEPKEEGETNVDKRPDSGRTSKGSGGRSSKAG